MFSIPKLARVIAIHLHLMNVSYSTFLSAHDMWAGRNVFVAHCSLPEMIMEKLAIEIPFGKDLAFTVRTVLSTMGSLKASVNAWSDFLIALGASVGASNAQTDIDLNSAAEQIVTEAVQVSSRRDDSPAHCEVDDDGEVLFFTPHGVEVGFAVWEGAKHVSLEINFYRNSHYLAVAIAAALFDRKVPGASKLLLQAAQESVAAGL
ncbi:MAG: hypothetical protein U0136_13375 [Bdellovibrionota bacterium]